MSEGITPDEAIAECLKLGAQGISLGLAKQLQAERDALKKQVESLSFDISTGESSLAAAQERIRELIKQADHTECLDDAMAINHSWNVEKHARAKAEAEHDALQAKLVDSINREADLQVKLDETAKTIKAKQELHNDQMADLQAKLDAEAAHGAEMRRKGGGESEKTD